MKRLSLLFLALIGSMIFSGCNTGEVSESDVRDYQNAGRDPNDPVIDPNTGQPVEGK